MKRKIPKSRQILNLICLLLSGLALGWMVGLSVSPVIQTIIASLMAVVVSVCTTLAGLPREKAEGNEDDSIDSRIKSSRAWRRDLSEFFNPLPVMLMVVGLSCGASVGVYGRANNWLGARTNVYVEEWKETGLTPKEITTRVFNLFYPSPSSSGENSLNESENFQPTMEKSADNGQPTIQNKTKPESKKESYGAPGENQTSKTTNSFRAGILYGAKLEQCARLRNIEDEEELRREMATSDERLASLARTCTNIECLRSYVEKVCAKYR